MGRSFWCFFYPWPRASRCLQIQHDNKTLDRQKLVECHMHPCSIGLEKRLLGCPVGSSGDFATTCGCGATSESLRMGQVRASILHPQTKF